MSSDIIIPDFHQHEGAMHKVVVTGYGVISPIGNSVEEFERRMFAGESGIKSIRGAEVSERFPVPHAGVVDVADLPSAEELGLPPELVSKGIRFAVLATQQALEYLPSGLPIDGIVYGTPGGVFFELVMDTFSNFDPENFVWDRTRAEWAPEFLASMARDRGHGDIPQERVVSMNSACASGNHAIGLGYQFLKAGRWKRCLVGGLDSAGWGSSLMNYYLLNALTIDDVPSGEASRPFSKDRSGFVKSEAAATLLMETLESAKERGARILGEVCGFGLTSDAHRLTDGREDGLCVKRAMELAVETAGISKEDIDYINAHGTSTPLNDRLETIAIREVFGKHAYRIPVSSLKSQIGHPTVASSAVEAIACLLMLQRQKLAPTINLKVKDPECDLDYVPNVSRDAKVAYILSNALGFGGQNACIVFKGAD
jgi:3-oxoacyl-[acyl-carrier-protein] synthase II